MILPRGITGFWASGEDGPPFCDLRAFRGHCYEAARLANAKVISTAHAMASQMARNYLYAVFEMPNQSIVVLLNAHYPWIAFAQPPREGQCQLSFVDVPEIARCFSEFKAYRVLEMYELGIRPTWECYQELSEAEIRRIKYFEPASIGDIVFNYWD